MAQSYMQIQKKIEALRRQADKLRTQEVKGVVERIRVAIAHYGLTAEQLGLGSIPGAKKATTARALPVSASAKYGDGQGNGWSGRGPRPRWLRDALDAGRSLAEFTAGAAAVKATRSQNNAAGKKAKAHYRDQAGNRWSGMGPRPRWLKEALAAGQTLEQLTA